MKYLMIIIIMLSFSCQSTKKDRYVSSNAQALVYYSKGACKGECPVYDLWIYEDGTISYVGVNNVAVKGKIKASLSHEELKNLLVVLEKGTRQDFKFNRVRDMPVTTIAYKGVEKEYYSSKMHGDVKEMDLALEMIANSMTEN